MNTQVLFLSAEYVKANSALDENLDNETIKASIKRAQDKYIWSALGSQLYSKLLTDIQNGTLSGNYKILVDDYITPCLNEYVVYEVLPFIHFQLTNKSIEVKVGDSQQPADRDDLIYLRNTILDMAQFYLKRLIDYLTNNTNLFTEYSSNSGADLSPNRKSYSSSIYTPKGDCGCGGPGLSYYLGCPDC